MKVGLSEGTEMTRTLGRSAASQRCSCKGHTDLGTSTINVSMAL